MSAKLPFLPDPPAAVPTEPLPPEPEVPLKPGKPLTSTILISPTIQNISGSVGSLVTADYPKTTTVTEILPFRLTITNIGIEGYRADNPPGIGVQVIGFSNYIL